MPPLDPKNPIAVGASSYDLGMIIQEQDGNVHPPKVLIAKDSPLGTQLSRTLRFTKEGKQQPTLQLIEGTRFGNMTWNRLGKLPLQTCFEGRTDADPLQLSVETDSSGLLTIMFPGNRARHTVNASKPPPKPSGSGSVPKPAHF